MQHKFMDLWDTVRTRDQVGNASELVNQSLGVAHIILSLLNGCTIVLSQTHGFDSSIIIGSANPLGSNSASFRMLIQRGYIRFHLFNVPDLKSAFRSALLDEEYIFSAWPEVHTGEVDRRALLEALSGSIPASLPDFVRSRMETVLAIDSVSKAASHGGRAIQPSNTLAKILMDIASSPAVQEIASRDLVKHLASLSNNKRSILYSEIDRYRGPKSLLFESEDDEKLREIKDEARQLVDICYNASISESLVSNRCILTTNVEDLVGLVRKSAFQASEICAFADVEVPSYISEVGWEELLYFLNQVKEQNTSEIESEAEASKLLVKKAFEHCLYYAVLPKVPTKLLSGLLSLAVQLPIIYTQEATVDLGVATIGAAFVVAMLSPVKESKRTKDWLEDIANKRLSGLLKANK